MTSNGLVQRLWSYCQVLRDDGLSYGDYLEQLTYLLFLKMADEQTKPPFSRPAFIPGGLDWPSLLARDGDELEVQYRRVLTDLGREPGMLGVVFRKAQNRIQDPAKLRRLIADLINKEQWMTLDADVKGDAYEGLLQRNAEDVKTGAGQYFTPRPLIRAIVEVMQPEPGMAICDPACGTGGFLLAAYEYISRTHPYLDPDQKHHLRFDALRGTEIVDTAARLCVMNLLLHGIGAEDADSPITVDDSLKGDPGYRYEMVLTNPPFGKKSSMTFVNTEGETEREDLVILRDDFWASTSNKQLNFLQHVKTLLAINGRAAIVVPDNVLFEGGLARRYGATCCTGMTSTPCCACRPGSSMRRASRRTFCSSTASRRQKPRGRRRCGSTTCERTCTSRSSRTRCATSTSRTSSPPTRQRTAASAPRPSGSNRSPTTS
jgi:type I restriction enzyme M protein